MRTVVICDDNISFCDLLEKYIKEHEKALDIKVIKFYDGDHLREYCNNNSFDILVLDIELGEDNGLEIAKELKEINPGCLTIYVSAHDGYYMDMVQAEPFRFVSKDPLNMQTFEKEFASALSDAVKRLNNGKTMFAYEFDKMQYSIDLDKIFCFYSSVHTIHICGEIGGAPDYFYGKIDDLDNMLQKISKTFVRVNKRYIVNVRLVQRIKGNRQIVVDGKTISLASGYRDNFIKKYCDNEK